MTIELINQPSGILPVINRERVKARGNEEIVDFLMVLIKALKEDLLRDLIHIINAQLSMMNVGVVNFQLPDVNGVYADGSWRLMYVSGGVELQKKVAGVWLSGTDAVARWEY
jgi:hypothetical protein